MASVSTSGSSIIFLDDEGSADSQSVSTPLSVRDTAASTPDTTPSRRSSRKKQSTFSSDFEYYTPIGRKKNDEPELKPGSGVIPKCQQAGKELKENPVSPEEDNKNEVENNQSEKRTPMKRKVAVKKGKAPGKGPERKGDSEEDENLLPEMSHVKVAAKKIPMKGTRGRPIGQNKKGEKTVEESTEDEDKVTPKHIKGQKRKKLDGKVIMKGKKIKTDMEVGQGYMSDEESTPVSPLKTQIPQKKPGGKKIANKSSPLAQNLMKKLIEVIEISSESGSTSDISPGTGQKRKLSAGDGPGREEAPSKAVKSGRGDKLTPALAGLVKRFPPSDLGLIKRSPSEIAAKLGAVQKAAKTNGTAAVEKAPEIKTSLETVDDSRLKLVADVAVGRLSAENDKTSKVVAEKTETGKTGTKEDSVSKNVVEKIQNAEKVVKKQSKLKEILRHVARDQIMKKHGGLAVKKKVLSQEEKLLKSEGKQTNIKVLETKSVEKLTPDTGKKKKVASQDQKPQVAGGSNLSKQLGKTTDTKQKSALTQAKVGGSGRKNQHELKKINQEGVKKRDLQNQKVDDLLKRGIFHKKKSHQPFGNRSVTKVAGKDLKHESTKDVLAKQDQTKKKPIVQKTEDKAEVKKLKGSERRKSQDLSKNNRVNSSNKGGKRKPAENIKKSDKQPSVGDDEKNGIEDEPPPLTPISAISKHKHKHHKSEHEIPLDMTMMDLFKPDGLVIHDQHKKDVTSLEGKSGLTENKSQYQMDVYDSSTFIKPENLHHVLIEHQYSKSSPVVKQDNEKNVGVSTGTGRDDDIESVSHKQTVIMDMNLPDQILEESEEPVVEESTSDVMETWQDTQEDIQTLVSKRDAGDRPSILECLNTELKESGTEFRIVGQVEVDRVPLLTKEKCTSTLQISGVSTQGELLKKNQKDSNIAPETKKLTAESKKINIEVKKQNAEVKKQNAGVKKQNFQVKKPNAESKMVNIEVEKQNSEIKKHDSDTKKPSAGGRKDSTDRKDNTVARSDSLDKQRPKKRRKSDNTGDEQQDIKDVKNEEDADSEEHGFEDDQDDADWEPNNPDTLYCICRKPHNNRFMICCDKCEEWFHGSCVGITTARGKEMEDKEEEYICPVCSKGEADVTLEKPVASPKRTEVTLVKPKLLQRCVGHKCSKSPRPGSVYCSNECIMSHAQESLKTIREEQLHRKIKEKDLLNEGSKSSSSSAKTAPSSSFQDTVEVIERQTGRVLKGTGAPTQKGLHRWLEQHPTFEVVLPHRHHRSRSSSSKDEKQRDKDTKSAHDRKPSSDRERKTSTDKDKKTDRDDRSRHSSGSSKDSGKRSDSEKREVTSQKPEISSSSSKVEEKKDDGPNQIRINVRTALRDCLSARAQEAEDIMLSSTEIKNLAVTIEEQLFSLFNDTGHKYRTKYRSLVFNIKDQKNKGLFRKILTGKIKPHKLVQMSTEELASRELAKWREQATKHDLEMIEKTEQEAMKDSEGVKHVRKKTHKGEVEVEDEDLSILEARLEERKDPEPEPQEEQTQVSAIDTTDQHRAHLFDLNCKVCTGKIVPGLEEQAAMSTVERVETTVVTKVDVPLEDKIDLEIAEEIVKEALQSVQKLEQAVSSMPKIDSSSPMSEETPPPPPPLSPKPSTSRRESSSSASSASSSSMRKKIVVRSPDSALQSGLEAKLKFIPTGPILWKGFVSMLDVAKFFTSAYRVSGPTDHVIIPDTIHILGRISPDHMWDYLSKIRQAGSKDVTVIRFIPGSDDEKVAYVHLYSYLNSRSRCGVAGNPNKKIKDFYIVPLASHSKIPRTLLPFDGPGLEENRPHMLIGIMVRQHGKHSGDSSAGSGKHASRSSTRNRKPTSQSSSESGKSSHRSSSGSGKHVNQSSTGSGTKRVTPAVNRDPRLAKLAARDGSPMMSPAESNSSSGTSSIGEAKAKNAEEYGPEYIPTPVVPKNTSKSVAYYVPTPTVRKRDKEKEKSEDRRNGKSPASGEFSGRDSKEEKEKHRHHHKDHHRHHHHHHHHKKTEKENDLEDDSEPYSPGKEAEPYSPSQEAAADEPYDPADENLMDNTEVIIVSSTEVSDTTTTSSTQPVVAETATDVTVSTSVGGGVVSSSEVAQIEQATVLSASSALQGETSWDTSDLVEKMARSVDPHEISSLMVTALSTTSSSQEQQKLLVDLTKKVEERKLQLAEATRQASPFMGSRSNSADEGDKLEQGSEQSNPEATNFGIVGLVDAELSSVSSTQDVSTVVQGTVSSVPANTSLGSASEKSVSSSPFMFNMVGSSSQFSNSLPGLAPEDVSSSKPLVADLSHLSTSSSSLPTSTSLATPSKESKDTGGVKFSFTKSKAKPQQILSTSTAEVFSSETTESKSKLPTLRDGTLSKQSFISDSSQSHDSGKSQKTADHHAGLSKSGDIPDALKALMNNMMGKTQFSSLEKRRKMLLKKEARKAEKVNLEPSNEGTNALESQKLLDEQAVALKRMEDEDVARRILDGFKKAKSDSSDNVPTGSNVTSYCNKPETEDTKQTQAVVPPSIDELLERLKKGGFQFQKTDSNGSSSSYSALTTTQPSSVATANSQPSEISSHSLFTSTTSTLQPCSVTLLASSTATASSSTTCTSTKDVDLRQKIDLPPLPPSLPPVPPGGASAGASSLIGTAESKMTDFGDFDARVAPDLQDRDDRNFYKDQDDGLYKPASAALPNYPTEHLTFPPLPADILGYPATPHPSTILPPPHGPLHPQFPVPPAEPHVPYSRSVLHPPPPPGRPQPPPPGTESEEPVGVLGITNICLPADMDLRSNTHPPLPPDQMPLPPQPPPQPPPPLPPLSAGQLPSGDVDYRNVDTYRSNHSYTERERGGHYYRH